MKNLDTLKLGRLAAFALLALSSTGCQLVGTGSDRIQATSLLGRPLYSPELSADRTARLEEDLRAARAAWDARPRSEERTIWVGRRLAYLGRYRAAIDWYSRGLEKQPNSYRLLRHRGHRYITTRNFVAAAADLGRAAELCSGLPNTIEQDGAPNRYDIPRSTTQGNIYYHLGLALYLLEDYEGALHAYRRCMELGRGNDDSLVATGHWLYMTLRRLGREAEAREVAQSLGVQGMSVIENHGYYHLMRMYRGDYQPAEVEKRSELDGISNATVQYGLANWSLHNGNYERALPILAEIVSGPAWPAFGFIAAENDLARMRDALPPTNRKE